jgi:hypothetical protein
MPERGFAMSTTYGFGSSPDCCSTVREGQLYLVSCAETKAEGLWSPAEQGTLQAWQAEHGAAHQAKFEDELRRESYAERRRTARYIYRTTEPGDARRRGIGAYL